MKNWDEFTVGVLVAIVCLTALLLAVVFRNGRPPVEDCAVACGQMRSYTPVPLQGRPSCECAR